MMNLFTTENILHFVRELVWWIFSAAISFAVLYPVVQKVDYFYYPVNFAFVFVALTYLRWALTLRSLPFLHPGIVRFLLFTFNLSLFIFFMQQEQKFIGLLDIFYTEDFGIPKQYVIFYDDVKTDFFKYLRTELIFSSTTALIAIAALNLRLIISWWQFYKHKAAVMLEE